MTINDLPERTKEHVSNDIARSKLRGLFNDPLFIVREETDNDYGVDVCIEAIINKGKSPSNIRAHIQLKSSGKKPKKDGVYSYSVSRKNLNYLINNPGSLYVFYSVPNKQFYFRYADDLHHEYNNTYSKSHKQEYITVNFHKVLNKKSVEEIHTSLINIYSTV